jgi:hypothetical protein
MLKMNIITFANEMADPIDGTIFHAVYAFG